MTCGKSTPRIFNQFSAKPSAAPPATAAAVKSASSSPGQGTGRANLKPGEIAPSAGVDQDAGGGIDLAIEDPASNKRKAAEAAAQLVREAEQARKVRLGARGQKRGQGRAADGQAPG